MKLRHLLWLYPPAWRARYGDELLEIVGTRRATPSALIDLIAGAADAWLRPQSSVAARPVQEKSMMATLMKRCAAGPNLSTRDAGVGAAITVGGTLAITIVYLYLAVRYRGNELVHAFGLLLYPISLTLTMPFTSLRNKSWSFKLVVMTLLLLILAVASYVAVLI
jgi:hypothetical protein